MDYAKDLQSGEIVAADDASSIQSYACPRPGCGGRVYLPDVVIQRPHFRHYPNEGTKACDEYFPGIGGGEHIASTAAGTEEGAVELGLLLTQIDGRWGLGLRLPEIPNQELGETSLSALRPALVDVYAGCDRLLSVGALDLRPGVGAACVEIAPTLQALRTEPGGSWPESIDRGRWLLESRGIEANGVLFRLRGAEWTRLVAGAGVHLGEPLLVLAETRCVPPHVSETHARLSGAGLQWCIWEVRLPSEPLESVTAWLARLGHSFVPRPWAMHLATPPRGHGDDGEPIFWVGDLPVLTLQAPQPVAAAMVSFRSETNSHSANVAASQSGVAHVGAKAREPGLTRLDIAGERTTSLDIGFSRPPSRTALRDELMRTPRLRVRIGQETLEAWQAPEHRVRVPLREQLDVWVDLGLDTARARVAMWQRGKQRIWRGFDARGVERAIADGLATASRIEIDVDNLGRVVVLPVRAALETHRKRMSNKDRLAWRDEVVAICAQHEADALPTLLERAGTTSLIIRRVSAAVLVRSRLALRRRLETGGTRQ